MPKIKLSSLVMPCKLWSECIGWRGENEEDCSDLKNYIGETWGSREKKQWEKEDENKWQKSTFRLGRSKFEPSWGLPPHPPPPPQDLGPMSRYVCQNTMSNWIFVNSNDFKKIRVPYTKNFQRFLRRNGDFLFLRIFVDVLFPFGHHFKTYASNLRLKSATTTVTWDF